MAKVTTTFDGDPHFVAEAEEGHGHPDADKFRVILRKDGRAEISVSGPRGRVRSFVRLSAEDTRALGDVLAPPAASRATTAFGSAP